MSGVDGSQSPGGLREQIAAAVRADPYSEILQEIQRLRAVVGDETK